MLQFIKTNKKLFFFKKKQKELEKKTLKSFFFFLLCSFFLQYEFERFLLFLEWRFCLFIWKFSKKNHLSHFFQSRKHSFFKNIVFCFSFAFLFLTSFGDRGTWTLTIEKINGFSLKLCCFWTFSLSLFFIVPFFSHLKKKESLSFEVNGWKIEKITFIKSLHLLFFRLGNMIFFYSIRFLSPQKNWKQNVKEFLMPSSEGKNKMVQNLKKFSFFDFESIHFLNFFRKAQKEFWKN